MAANDAAHPVRSAMRPQQADVEPRLVLHGHDFYGAVVGVDHAALRFLVIASFALRSVSYQRENSSVPCGLDTLAIFPTILAWAGFISLPTIR